MTTLTRSINECSPNPIVDRRKYNRGTPLIDHTGDRFGRLVVVKRAENWGKQVAWFCTCDCGGTNIVPGVQLRRGQVRSCGCICRGGPHGKPMRGRRGSAVGLSSLYSIYQSNARKRQLEWALSHEQFTGLVQSDCTYCGRAPKAKKRYGKDRYILYTGIDRMDNAIGYTPGNSVPCCRECNIAKHADPLDKFREWLLLVAARYHGNICENAVSAPVPPPRGIQVKAGKAKRKRCHGLQQASQPTLFDLLAAS